MSGDFERLLTKRAWTDDQFAAKAESDPVDALKSIGVDVPPGVKVKIVVQRRDPIYFTIPPARDPAPASDQTPVNQIDLWSSGGLFIWITPLAFKFQLLALRNAVRTQEG